MDKDAFCNQIMPSAWFDHFNQPNLAWTGVCKSVFNSLMLILKVLHIKGTITFTFIWWNSTGEML